MADKGKQRIQQPAMAYEAVMRRVQAHVEQLESLAHGCSVEARDKALKLSGHIDEGLTIANVSITRVDMCDRYRAALSAVMKPKPKVEPIDMAVATGALAQNISGQDMQSPSVGQTTRVRPKVTPIVPQHPGALPGIAPPDLG